MAEKLPSLKVLKGIDKLIPNGKDLVRRDGTQDDEDEESNEGEETDSD
jgi:hypothetical protein